MDFNNLANIIVGPDRYFITQLATNKSSYPDGTPALILSIIGHSAETDEEKTQHFMMPTAQWQEFFGICYTQYVTPKDV